MTDPLDPADVRDAREQKVELRMMYTIPRWRVIVSFATGPQVVFWIHDSHLSNVLRKVADMQFREDSLDQPMTIAVGTPTVTGVKE